MKMIAASVVFAGALGLSAPAQAVTATFDDLPAPPAVDSATGLFFANDDSSTYAGVVWDSRFTVVGKAYRTDPNAIPPGPLFGIPSSGDYFVSNTGSGGNDGLLITTTMVLLGASFGRNEYYGFGGGADQLAGLGLIGWLRRGRLGTHCAMSSS